MALTPEDFIDLLNGIPSRIAGANYSPALEEAAGEVFDSVEKNFARQVDDDGVAWPPRKDDLSHPLLILSGDLIEAASGGLGSHVRYSRKNAELGVVKQVIPYSRVHNEGFENIPRRRYFYLHEDERPRVLVKFGEEESKQFRKFVLKRGV